MSHAPILWTPSPERVKRSNLHAFVTRLRERGALPRSVPDGAFPALQRWSVEHLEAFWDAAWTDAAVACAAPRKEVLANREMPVLRFEADRQWFPGARFNVARHLLRYRDGQTALLSVTEDGRTRQVSYAELYTLVCRAAGALQSMGVRPCDRVVGYLPNGIEAVVTMLATTALGAIWSSTSPDFGEQGVLDRFGQIDPKVMVCADGYRYGGKAHGTLERALRIAGQIPSIRHVVVVPFLDASGAAPEGALGWEAFLALGDRAPAPAFPAFAFDHPAFILYSSGTTGVPKCIVHGAGGTLLKHHVEQKLHADVRREDRLFFFTTCGWMMWNWLVSGLAQGATLVLYDGSPAWPEPGRLFRLAEETGITIFGTSPKYLAGCRNAELRPGARHDLSRLRAILSTGAPLEPELFDWVYAHVKTDAPLASISGGTDIVGCFMLGNPFMPVRSGEIQAAALGVDAAALDEAGRPVTGRKAELVCRQPIPSMPLGFWKDPDGKRFRAAYFERFPGVWHHGDFVEFRAHGGVVVYGRSDATLNPGGVRIGTAEIYRIVESLPEIQDSLVVGQDWQGDVRVLLFVVPAAGHRLDAALEQKLRDAIRKGATPRHVPAKILPIREVPVTLNGKKVELAVTRMLQGEPVTNREALANPQSLDQFDKLEIA